LIQLSSGADNREMYQVFNMGHRLEVFTDDGSAVRMIELAESFDIEAQVVGRVEAAVKKELIIDLGGQQISYLS
jgi:phosphoribosylformylglycinamidine cyclo-ligase